MAVATVESMLRTLILLKMAVSPANSADNSAITTHIAFASF